MPITNERMKMDGGKRDERLSYDNNIAELTQWMDAYLESNLASLMGRMPPPADGQVGWLEWPLATAVALQDHAWGAAARHAPKPRRTPTGPRRKPPGGSAASPELPTALCQGHRVMEATSAAAMDKGGQPRSTTPAAATSNNRLGHAFCAASAGSGGAAAANDEHTTGNRGEAEERDSMASRLQAWYDRRPLLLTSMLGLLLACCTVRSHAGGSVSGVRGMPSANAIHPALQWLTLACAVVPSAGLLCATFSRRYVGVVREVLLLAWRGAMLWAVLSSAPPEAAAVLDGRAGSGSCGDTWPAAMGLLRQPAGEADSAIAAAAASPIALQLARVVLHLQLLVVCGLLPVAPAKAAALHAGVLLLEGAPRLGLQRALTAAPLASLLAVVQLQRRLDPSLDLALGPLRAAAACGGGGGGGVPAGKLKGL